MRFEQPYFLAAGAGGQHHCLRRAEAHFARREIGDDDCEFADELLRRIGRFDAGEHCALFIAEVVSVSLQLVRVGYWKDREKTSEAENDRGEVFVADWGLFWIAGRC